MATKTTSPPAPAPPSQASTSKKFFDWMRALNLPRRHGWIGGVCAGIAERMGIDPLIVRGIAVVIAILGGPAILLYAVAWLLLPDSEDSIHLERLFRGEFDAAHLGIAALVVLSLLPMAQGFWFLGASYWAEPHWGASVWRATWTIVLITAAVLVTIWLARRARNSSADPTVVPATTDARPDTVPQPATASAAATAAEASTVASTVAEPAAKSTVPLAPPAPAAGAPSEEMDAWREQQSRWKAEHDAWKAQEAASAKELRAQRAVETHERAVANSAMASERRRLRRLANPRVTGSHVVVTLGAALLIGGVAALVSQSGESWSGYGVVVGLATATITVGLSAMVAGIARRRSGFLGFVALLLAVSTVLVSFVPPDRTVVGVAAGVALDDSGRYSQAVGSITVASVNDSALARTSTLDLWQGAGTIYIEIPDGMIVRVEANLGEPNLSHYRVKKVNDEWQQQPVATTYTHAANGRVKTAFTIGAGSPVRTVRLWQGTGSVFISQRPSDEVLFPQEPDTSAEQSTSPAPRTPDPAAKDPATSGTGVKP